MENNSESKSENNGNLSNNLNTNTPVNDDPLEPSTSNNETTGTRDDLQESVEFARELDNGELEVVVIKKEGEEEKVIYRGPDRRHEHPQYDQPEKDGQVERVVFSRATVWIRNIGGAFSTLVVNLTAIAYCYIVYVSVSSKGVWPDNITMIIIGIGPIIIAWTIMNVNKTITTILGGENKTDKMRSKIANLIKPK